MTSQEAVWAAIHHYEADMKNKGCAYIPLILRGLYEALEQIKKYKEMREFINVKERI